MTEVGLRIDVDTFCGTREGVSRLLEILGKHNVQASIFSSVGPDSMGHYLWRLIKPQFSWRILRPNAASPYGWDILSVGTAWLGREIGHASADTIHGAAKHHEVGLHAWDHHVWQTHSGSWDRRTMIGDIACGLCALEEIIGQPITCSVVVGRRVDQQVVGAKETFHLYRNSDCRGAVPFRPLLGSGTSGTAQIPVALPTWDGVISWDVKAEDFSGWLLNRTQRDKGTPVYTIYAEAEGYAYQHNFVDLLKRVAQEGVTFCPLSKLLSETLLPGQVVRGNIVGREGWLGCQQIVGSH